MNSNFEPPKPISPAAQLNETPQTDDHQQSGNPVMAALSFLFEWLIIPAAIVAFLYFFVFQAFRVVGYSMTPTLQNSDYLVVSKVEASWTRLTHFSNRANAYIPARNQIVIFRYPAQPATVFVKRVIGLPGDRVVVSNGKVTVYNTQNPKGFNPDANHQVSDPVSEGDINEVVPSGNVFVMGDNRTPGGSFDSRDWGFLPSFDIIGVAKLRLLPPNRITLISFIPAELAHLL